VWRSGGTAPRIHNVNTPACGTSGKMRNANKILFGIMTGTEKLRKIGKDEKIILK
jgi:hypothetical protein